MPRASPERRRRARAMDLRKFDLNLLLVLEALFAQRSVSRAAQALNLSQPAVSAALARLRAAFDDALFVRSRTGVQPTPLAETLRPPLADALRAVEAMTGRRAFDPAASDRRFRLYMTDLGQYTFLPPIVDRLAREAPGVRLETVTIPVDAVAGALEAGEIDLAVGSLPALAGGRTQARLFTDRYVALVPAGLVGERRALTLAQLRAARLASTAMPGSGHQAIERTLIARGLGPNIVVRVPNFLLLPGLVERIGLIAHFPAVVARLVARPGLTEWVDSPLRFPTSEVRVHWHRRLHDDPANRWLRELLVAELAPLGDPALLPRRARPRKAHAP